MVPEERLFLSSITIGEIQKGIDLIPWPRATAGADDRRRQQADLDGKLGTLCERFAGRIVDVDARVARAWGRLHAEFERRGRKTPIVDTLIAACAVANDLVLASCDADMAAFDDVLTRYDPIRR